MIKSNYAGPQSTAVQVLHYRNPRVSVTSCCWNKNCLMQFFYNSPDNICKFLSCKPKNSIYLLFIFTDMIPIPYQVHF